jgi:hypothetical protein
VRWHLPGNVRLTYTDPTGTPETHILHRNHLNSVTTITGSDSVWEVERAYEPFGNDR